jgi:hypothetical protein
LIEANTLSIYLPQWLSSKDFFRILINGCLSKSRSFLASISRQAQELGGLSLTHSGQYLSISSGVSIIPLFLAFGTQALCFSEGAFLGVDGFLALGAGEGSVDVH